MAITAQAGAAIAFKGRMMALTVVEIRDSDPERLAQDIQAHMAKAGDFFLGMPVVISLGDTSADLSVLADLLRGHGMVPVALLDGDPDQAATAGLGVIGAGRVPTEPKAEPRRAPARAARTITRPVRSGQQIYARDTDLVVMAAVGEGAEVIADGHIHIYGTLRGRALAGAQGDTSARIFCRRFEPELVAVAGNYKVADDMPDSWRGQAVQVRLDGESLIIEKQE
ncbi:MAG: septum site-determining protein MinC [Salinisphaeraceae bacterium]